MSDEARRRRRRRLLLLGLAPLLLALGFAAKVAVMLALDHGGRASYHDAAYADARGSFAGNRTLNVLEPWVAPYDEGTARIRESDFTSAVSTLGVALREAPADEECRVRINLALAHEGVGDAASVRGAADRARKEYRRGVEVLAEGGCLDVGQPEVPPPSDQPPDGPTAGAADPARAEDATGVDRRLREKLAVTTDQAQPPPDDSEQQAAELDERNQQGEDERSDTEQRHQDQQDQPPPRTPSGTPSGTPPGTPPSAQPPPPTYAW